MITSIELGNVRIFADRDWDFQLSPLTILCGTNSAGKSTLLKVLLLLLQSQRENTSSVTSQGKLRFIGPFADLGNYESFVSNNQSERNIFLSITIAGSVPPGLFRRIFSTSDKTRPITNESQEPRQASKYSLKSSFEFCSRVQRQNPDTIEDVEEATSSTPQGWLKAARFEMLLENGNNLKWDVTASEGNERTRRPEYRIRMPKALFENEVRPPIDAEGIYAVDEQVEVTASLRGLLADAIELRYSTTRIDLRDADRVSLSARVPLPSIIQLAQVDLSRALSRLNYLGPLRAPARRYYVTSSDDLINSAVDSVGESLPYVLKDQRDVLIWHVRPGADHTVRREALSIALGHWLFYLRTGQEASPDVSLRELGIRSTQDVLVELQVKTPNGGYSHSLADSGFGYSQVLPILTKGLQSPRGSTLMVEQPELHLNPALQIRLAEFFVAMTRAGKQVLLETHSEHIVNAVRVLTAEDDTGMLASQCKLYYIDIHAQSNRPLIRQLDIETDGTVPEWPQHFFGEALTLTSRLLKAQRRFRAQR